MLIFRWLLLWSLLGSIVSFGLYVATGQLRYRVFALRALKWAVLMGVGFFVVLILERLA